MKEKERKDFLKKWWLIALIPILLSACSIDENAVQDDEIEEVVEEAEEKEEPKENELIEVEIEFDNKVKDGILEVKGDTNLPRSTIVKVTVSSENDFLFEEEVKIGMMGGFKVKDISDDVNPLKPGNYSVQLILSPLDQEEKILEKIGDKGELLSGESITENEGIFILAEDTVIVEEVEEEIENDDNEKQKDEEEPEANRTIDIALVEDNDYISEANLTDGKLTLIADGKTTFSENTLFYSVYDLFEAMHDGFQDENVNEIYVELMVTMIDSKGNESIEPVIKYNYDRETFEELNYENFTNMAYSEEWRILREANYYYIHPGIYKNLKDKYKDNLNVEGFKE